MIAASSYAGASRHHTKMHARQQYAAAVRTGKLKRAEACERCSSTGCRIDGHHESYQRPLDVVWLCEPCHRKRHREIEWSALLASLVDHPLYPVLAKMPADSRRTDMPKAIGVSLVVLMRILRGHPPIHEVALRIEYVTGILIPSRPSGMHPWLSLAGTRAQFDPSVGGAYRCPVYRPSLPTPSSPAEAA